MTTVIDEILHYIPLVSVALLATLTTLSAKNHARNRHEGNTK